MKALTNTFKQTQQGVPMSKHRDEPAAEETIAATLDPKTYLLVRLNAAHSGHEVLPAEEGWKINTAAQKLLKI